MTRASLVLAALLVAVPTFAQTPVAGDWELTIQSPTGTRTVPLILKQDGEKVTGMFKGPQGELPVEGTLVADDLKFSFSIPIQGTSIDIVMAGKLANDAVSGTAQFGGFGEGPFTMKRPQKAVEAAIPTTTEPPVPAGLAGGKWDVTLKTPGGDFPATANFKEDAGKLTGTFGSQMGEVPVTGTIEGKAIKLSMVAKTPQGDITVEMSGDVDGDSIVNGKADVAGMGQMEWTAKRAKQ